VPLTVTEPERLRWMPPMRWRARIGKVGPPRTRGRSTHGGHALTYAGIDVHKEELGLVVLEATGALEQPAAPELRRPPVCTPGVIVNPPQVRYFTKAMGRLAKVDPASTRRSLRTSPKRSSGPNLDL
jgi:hypothetical protein